MTPGSRVRLSLSGEQGRVVGTVSSLDERAMVLDVDGTARTVLLSHVDAVSISDGRRSRARGAARGALIGAAVGALLGAAGGSDPEDAFMPLSAGEKAAVAGGTLAIVGALIGVAIPPSEKWRQTTPEAIRVSVQPTRGRGHGVRVAVAF